MLPETLGVHQARKSEDACVGVRIHLCVVREGQAWGLRLRRVTLISGFRLLSQFLQGREIILICYQGFPVTTSKGLEIKVGAHGLLKER